MRTEDGDFAGFRLLVRLYSRHEWAMAGIREALESSLDWWSGRQRDQGEG